MGAIESAVDRVRRPEYTGENRCYPCTIVNLVIALAVALLAVAVLARTAWAEYAAVGGAAVFVACVVPIAVRGYLVPGTPTLTKRYMPAWALGLFGKEPATPTTREDGGVAEGELDVEALLLESGALEPVPDGDDLQLTPAVREEWRAEIERIREADVDRDRLADIVGLEPSELSFREFSDSFRAYRGDHEVGTWESEAAYVADVAAAGVLEARMEEWGALPPAQRGRLLNGLRIFLDACPECDGPLTFVADTVPSCCSTKEVTALTCDDCEARLFEAPRL